MSSRSSTKPTQDTSQKDVFAITLTFWNTREVEDAYIAALARSRISLESEKGPLERIGQARPVLEGIIDFAEAVADMNPSAKIVTALFVKAWEHVETIQQNYDSMLRLVDGLSRMLPFLSSVRNYTSGSHLNETTTDLLNLIEDTGNFIIGYMSDTAAGKKQRARMLRSQTNNKVSEQINVLLRRFESLKEDFDRGVQIEQLKHILTNEQRVLLDRLNPASRAHYANTFPCQEGTREQVLSDIRQWTSDRDTTKKLGWLYGQAGLGKSCISASVCRELDGEHILGAHYFCKRDDPELRRPENVLNTIIHQLAVRFGSYGKEVASAISEIPQLPNSSLEQRYTHFIERPLRKLQNGLVTPSTQLIVVVDALDECEKTRGRRLLLTYFREMCRLVPWLKLMVTSRPDQDIKSIFGKLDDPLVCSRDILVYDASHDIYACTQKRMVEIAEFKAQFDWSEKTVRTLTERSGGLFIWIETACKFIENGSDVDTRLEQVLDGTQPVEGSEPLDILFTTAIEQSLDDGAQDNVRNARSCIGAIIATADRTPLSVTGLESLMSSQIKRGVFRNVVSGLGSVLYEDKAIGGAVRVYHPSFADYVATRSRSKHFHVESQEQNTRMAECCLRTMLKELKFNICGLTTSYLSNRDVPDLNSRVRNCISEHLKYSCLHWSSHLVEAPKGVLKELIGDFILGRSLLHWIEALSLLSKLKFALSSLLELVEWCSGTMDSIANYAACAYRLVLAFYDPISESTPHLYVSALAFAPRSSHIAQRMKFHFPSILTVETNTDSGWAPWMRNIPHGATVTSVAVSSDGSRIVTGSQNQLVQIWDSETGIAVCEPLKGHTNVVRSVAFSSGGRRIISGSYDDTARIWDSDTGAIVLVLTHATAVMCAIFSPDDQRIVTGTYGGMVHIWDANTGATVSGPLAGHSDSVNALTFTRDCSQIVSGSSDRTIRFWDAQTGTNVYEPLEAHADFVYCVAFSPDGRQMISGCNDGVLCVWNAETNAVVLELRDSYSGPIRSAAYSPCGQMVICGYWDKKIRIWDINAGTIVSNLLTGHLGAVRSVSFTPNGRRIVSGSEDGTVRIWDAVAAVAIPKLAARDGTHVSAVAFSPDSLKLASMHLDSRVRIWDVETGQLVCEPLFNQSDGAWSVQFSPDGRLLAGSIANGIWIWDTESSELVSKPLAKHEDLVWSIAFAPNSRQIASGSRDQTVRIWDVQTGVEVSKPFVGHTGDVRCVLFTPDGQRIVSCSNDKTIRIWDVASGSLLFNPLVGHSRPICSITISPNGGRLVSGAEDNTMMIWDPESGAAVSEPLMGEFGVVFSVAFSPDGERVAVAPYDNTVQIWDLNTRQIACGPLKGHTDFVKSVSWSPNGKYIASGSNDETIRIWEVDPSLAKVEIAVSR
ncbi:hypothetical protein FRC07_014911 [Ceratobasidium sp. 392]|nr:hypothetical protein FRC07_014911 [Ceratobasidium sp. 392]